KAANFGFARSLPETLMAEKLAYLPRRLYTAPEILSYRMFDAKADIWSVGAVSKFLSEKPTNHIDFNPDRLVAQPGKPAKPDPFNFAFGYGCW
ncbi:hypothetical protein EDB86DRAFT_2823904, partial [Lactarius hatsudake]